MRCARCVFVLLAQWCGPTLAEEAVGSIEFSRGTVAAESPGKPLRVLGTGEAIFVGDNIQTGERSFAVLAFKDKAKITVRPNSSFSIRSYISEGEQAGAELDLHKGGVRASSGDIAHDGQDKFNIHAGRAVVSASDADYSVRLCETDCAEEGKALDPVSVDTRKSVVARAVDVKGSVLAKNADQPDTRLLDVGAPVYQKDTVRTEEQSHALLVFRDGGRVTVDAASEFEIRKYALNNDPAGDAAAYRLVKGGLRALTGAIGKDNKKAYEVDTPVATMGIRGTGFDLHCAGDCSGEDGKPPRMDGSSEGLYSHVWKGGIDERNRAGSFPLDESRAAWLANRDSKLVPLPGVPSFFLANSSPRPDSVEIDMDELFGVESRDGSAPGVYISVEEGYVKVVSPEIPTGSEAAEPLYLGRDEAAHVDRQGVAVRMTEILNFQILDPYPSPAGFDPATAAISYSLLSDTALRAPGLDAYQCLMR